MKVDASKSKYREDPRVLSEFTRTELRRARWLLRRLRYLEAMSRDSNDHTSDNAMHVEWEIEALEWALGPDGINFLATPVTTTTQGEAR